MGGSSGEAVVVHRRWRGVLARLSVLTALGMCASLVAVMESQAAVAAGHKMSPLQSGLAFYKGKNITMIIDAPPGGTSDLTDRAVQPALSALLGANIYLNNVSIGSGIPAQDDIAAAQPDGLTIGNLSDVQDVDAVLTNTPALNFNPEREAFIGAFTTTSAVWVSQPGGPIQSFGDMLSARTPIFMCNLATGSAEISMRVLNGVFGIKANILTGFPTNGAVLQGFLDNDCQMTETSLAFLSTTIEAGKAHPILLSNEPPPGAEIDSFVAQTPTFQTIAKKYPLKSALGRTRFQVLADLVTIENPLIAPGKVPSDRLTALRWALEKAIREPSVIEALRSAGLGVNWVPGEVAKQQYVFALTKGRSIASYLQ